MKDCIEQPDASGDHRVIARLQPRDKSHAEAAVEKKVGIYIDTETTGFDLPFYEHLLADVEYEVWGGSQRDVNGCEYRR